MPLGADRTGAFGWADIAVLMTVLIWGFNFVVVKASLEAFTPLAFNALRFVIAAAIELVVLFKRGDNLNVSWRELRRVLPLALAGVLLYQVLFIYGIDRTTAGNASVLLATIPIFVGLYSGVLLREKIAQNVWLGAFFTFGGVALVTLGADQSVRANADTLLGDILVLFAAVCWAVYTVNSKSVMNAFSPLKLTTITMVSMVPILSLLALPEMVVLDWKGVSLAAWAGLLFSAVLSIAFAYLLWNIGVKRLGDARTAVYSNLTPVVSLAAAWVFLSEYLTRLQIFGAIVVLGGVWLARSDIRLRRQPPTGKAI